MKIYIVSLGCVFDGGTNRHVALTEARAIELAEALVHDEQSYSKDRAEQPFANDRSRDSTWKRDASARATTLACEVDDRSARRVAFWSDDYDFVAVHEWEVTT